MLSQCFNLWIEARSQLLRRLSEQAAVYTSLRGGPPGDREPGVLVLPRPPTHSDLAHVNYPLCGTAYISVKWGCWVRLMPLRAQKSESQLPFKEFFLSNTPESISFLHFCITRWLIRGVYHIPFQTTKPSKGTWAVRKVAVFPVHWKALSWRLCFLNLYQQCKTRKCGKQTFVLKLLLNWLVFLLWANTFLSLDWRFLIRQIN